jgi:hypothetical protein
MIPGLKEGVKEERIRKEEDSAEGEDGQSPAQVESLRPALSLVQDPSQKAGWRQTRGIENVQQWVDDLGESQAAQSNREPLSDQIDVDHAGSSLVTPSLKA